MKSITNPTTSQVIMLEEFFRDYPTEKAEQLFWRWFLACLQNDFTKVSQEELQEFSEFFERLYRLELAMQQDCGEIDRDAMS